MQCVITGTETSESQYAQAEEHCNKLKQLLVKTKKDLSEAKKLVSRIYYLSLNFMRCIIRCMRLCSCLNTALSATGCSE